MSLTSVFIELKGYVVKHPYGAWVGCCPRCGRVFVGLSQAEVFGPVDHHMRTEPHLICPGCRELQSSCGCATSPPPAARR